MYGLDTSVLMSPKVWEASGHTASFTNIMIDCLDCNYRTRADHLVEDALPDLGNVEGNLSSNSTKSLLITKSFVQSVKNKTGPKSVTSINFRTQIGIITEGKNTAYLRGELAQGMLSTSNKSLTPCTLAFLLVWLSLAKLFVTKSPWANLLSALSSLISRIEYFVKPKTGKNILNIGKRNVSVRCLFGTGRIQTPLEVTHQRRTQSLQLSHRRPRVSIPLGL